MTLSTTLLKYLLFILAARFHSLCSLCSLCLYGFLSRSVGMREELLRNISYLLRTRRKNVSSESNIRATQSIHTARLIPGYTYGNCYHRTN